MPAPRAPRPRHANPPAPLIRATAEAQSSAGEAGLRYTSDQTPGFTRHRRGAGFTYRDVQGRVLRDPAALQRIRSLAIPPAWRDVWICPDERGHLQATGRDERGRKQYRYHARWREVRDSEKFQHTLTFARALPKIRRRVARDLRQPGLGRDKALAAIVRLLDSTLIRIGNEVYRRQNHSIGLSTMRQRHVAVRGPDLRFTFRGKSGQRHVVDLEDPQLARLVRRLQELPGQELFQYLGDNDERHPISSTDVNAYLHEIAGATFSAKDFRTWAGTVLAALALATRAEEAPGPPTRSHLLRAVEAVAERLGNTPAICRRCYIHPAVMQAYWEGWTLSVPAAVPARRRGGLGLRPEEAAVLRFLQRRNRPPPGSTSRVPSRRPQDKRARKRSQAATKTPSPAASKA